MSADALWSRVAKQPGDDGCWLWAGYTDRNGYGRIEYRAADKRRYTRAAHVVIWEALNGPIPDELELDHRPTCPKRCVNPAHLAVVTHRENMLAGLANWAGRNARRTHCPKGHWIDGVRGDGRRYCRPCAVANVARWRRRVGHR